MRRRQFYDWVSDAWPLFCFIGGYVFACVVLAWGTSS